MFYFFRFPPPPRSTLFPYTTLFRSHLFCYRHEKIIENLQHDRIHLGADGKALWADRKSTRLNSSHVAISYAVFCLKKKKHKEEIDDKVSEEAHVNTCDTEYNVLRCY